MDDGSRPWLIAGILLIFAAYFALAETSFASVSRNKIKIAAERDEKNATIALDILNNIEKAISTILIGTNLTHIFIASLVTLAVTKKWGMSYVSIATIVTTLVVFFVGEMLPKSIGKRFSYRLSLLCAPSLAFFMKLFKPLASLLAFIGDKAAKLTSGEAELTVTEEEIQEIIEDMTEEGSLKQEQSDLINSALQFSHVTVESILTPRVDVVALDVNEDKEKMLETIKSFNHSRLPVYEGTIDNIIGVIQSRKFLKTYLKSGFDFELKDLLDEVLFVHQSTNIDDLLPVLSQKRLNMAVVMDSYGGTLGILTVENILEELVGDIWDEDDVIEEGIVDLMDGSCIAEADEIVSYIFEHLDYEDPEKDESLKDKLMGEWAYEHFDEIPKTGDSFIYHDLEIKIEKMDNMRIRKLRVSFIKKEVEE